jgi:integrase
MGRIFGRKGTKNLYIKYYKHGKAYVEATHSNKVEVAKRLLKLREGEISQGKLPGVVYERVKFDDLIDDLLSDYRINKRRTIKKEERCARYLLEEFGGMKAAEIDTSKIQKLIEKRMEEGFSNASINRELAALKRAFNLAQRCTPPKVAQVPYIPMLKENNVRKGFLEHEDFMALRDALPSYLKPVLTFGYFTGWRRGEILCLKWNQVNLKDGIVRLEPGETKNDQARTLYMEPELWEMMKDLHKKRRLDCTYVFHRIGKKIVEFRKSWATSCIKVGLCEPLTDENGNSIRDKKGKVVLVPNKLFHDLRRSGVRNMVRAGIPERVAMSISGHKTRSVFDRYNIVSQEDLKEAAKKRQAFNDDQNLRVQFRYNELLEAKKVVNINRVTK